MQKFKLLALKERKSYFTALVVLFTCIVVAALLMPSPADAGPPTWGSVLLLLLLWLMLVGVSYVFAYRGSHVLLYPNGNVRIGESAPWLRFSTCDTPRLALNGALGPTVTLHVKHIESVRQEAPVASKAEPDIFSYTLADLNEVYVSDVTPVHIKLNTPLKERVLFRLKETTIADIYVSIENPSEFMRQLRLP